MSAKEQQYKAFQEFQKSFFTSPTKFAKYTLFDVKKHGFVLLNNIAKGYPALMDHVFNLRGFGWDAFTSFELLRALQGKLLNPYNGYRLPSFLFFKTEKRDKSVKATKTDKCLEFSPEIRKQICEILMLDKKDYEYLKYSERVQKCGKQLAGDKEIIKQVKLKKK